MNTLLKSLCVGVSILLSSCSEQSSEQKLYNRGINIIPAPASLTQNDGTFKLTKNTKIYTAEPNLKVAEFFAAKLKASTGYSIEVSSQEARNGILLLLDPNLATGNDEGYTLDVTPPGITIKAKTAVTAKIVESNPSWIPIAMERPVTVLEWELGKPPLAMTQCKSHFPDFR